MNKNLHIRWVYLAIGTVAMLFAGILYAWSILKVPFAEGYGWNASQLSINFTITMSFFCVGGLLGARLAKAKGHCLTLILSGILSAAGFALTALLQKEQLFFLFLTYGGLAGLGIGIAYNVLVSTVSSWFPDKKGLCSGFLMMGFGASALVLGKAASGLMGSSLGWQGTYVLLGIALGAVLAAAGLLLKKPGPEVQLPAVYKLSTGAAAEDLSPMQMLKRPSFYLAFTYLVFLTAVGSFVISIARDLALDVGADLAMATTLVGVLSVFNGVGRIIAGACFDRLGCRKTMFLAAGLTIAASGVTLVAVLMGNLWLGIAGLCLTGLSYGACPTAASSVTSAFYGTRYFSTNMAIMIFSMMGSNFIGTFCNSLMASSGGFLVPFGVLLALSLAALVMNFFIKKP